MFEQMSLFDGQRPFKIDKPIRLITLFSGYDSQALALKYLGVPFEHYRTCEWAIPSIQALHDLHFGDDNTDYSAGMTKNDLVAKLAELGVSADYNSPVPIENLQRYPEKSLRTIYNNVKSAHNLVSICNARGQDLGIVETNKYCYIMTYSFPCQDLSSAGARKGMGRESNTRSGLLWEVERLLKETKELPQVLLMENVIQVIGKDNIKHFAEWVAFLDSLGYHSKWQVLNAPDYGVPQHRKRCFMVSVLGDHYYTFPEKIGGGHKLSDLLEENVSEKYNISERTLQFFIRNTREQKQNGNGFKFAPTLGGGQARTISTRAGSRMDDNFLVSLAIVENNLSGQPKKPIVSQQGTTKALDTKQRQEY